MRLYRRRDQRVLEFNPQTLDSLKIAFADEVADQSLRLDFLCKCLKLLEGPTRSMCELRYQQDLKPAAFAESIGMTANSVAKAQQRIHEQLLRLQDAASAESATRHLVACTVF